MHQKHWIEINKSWTNAYNKSVIKIKRNSFFTYFTSTYKHGRLYRISLRCWQHSMLWIKHHCSCNKKPHETRSLAPLLFAAVLRWTCKHFGKQKPSTKARQTGKRPNHAILPSGCKMSIYVAFDQLQNVYVIKKNCLDHNHPHGPEVHKQYVQNRLPDGDLQQQAIMLLEHGANPTLVADNLNRQGLETRPRDLYNLKQKLKFKGSCARLLCSHLSHVFNKLTFVVTFSSVIIVHFLPVTWDTHCYVIEWYAILWCLHCAVGSAVEDIKRVLSAPSVTYRITADSNGYIEAITWTTSDQLSLLQHFPHVVMMDGTYKVTARTDVVINTRG